jgi:hypothetical protein
MKSLKEKKLFLAGITKRFGSIGYTATLTNAGKSVKN